jgi:hypothetical protein
MKVRRVLMSGSWHAGAGASPYPAAAPAQINVRRGRIIPDTTD